MGLLSSLNRSEMKHERRHFCWWLRNLCPLSGNQKRHQLGWTWSEVSIPLVSNPFIRPHLLAVLEVALGYKRNSSSSLYPKSGADADVFPLPCLSWEPSWLSLGLQSLLCCIVHKQRLRDAQSKGSHGETLFKTGFFFHRSSISRSSGSHKQYGAKHL